MSLFVVISSPSGGGKDVIIKKLTEIFSVSVRLVTTTTRPPREGEKAGVNYNFITRKEFEKRIKQGAFLEYNNYNGNYYGVDKAVLSQTLRKFDLVFTNIDVHGQASLNKNKIKHIAIFLLPDSLAVLGKRIRQRGGVSEADLKRRMGIARGEIKAAKNYDYRVVNKDGKLKQTVEKLAGIILKHLTV